MEIVLVASFPVQLAPKNGAKLRQIHEFSQVHYVTKQQDIIPQVHREQRDLLAM